MSLAYKLWKIGNALDEDDIKIAIKDEAEFEESKEPTYLNINFKIENDDITEIEFSDNAISYEKLFFSKKIGGSGGGMYYLYPNLNIRGVKSGKEKEELSKKIFQLINTLEKSVLVYAKNKNKEYAESILHYLKNLKPYVEKAKLLVEQQQNWDELNSMSLNEDEKKSDKIKEKINKITEKIEKIDSNFDEWNNDFLNIIVRILKMKGSNYWLWLSINGETFYDKMPEVWDNWYLKPVIKNEDAKLGYDAFTNKEEEIGYRPEIKVFSYDNYHNNLNYRINDNLPLSLKSAKNVKFAWLYILENLVFYYRGLEYVIIPNVLTDDIEIYKEILKRFKRANKKTNSKKSILDRLIKEEKKLNDTLKKLEKIKNITNKLEVAKLKSQQQEKNDLLKMNEKGMIEQFAEEVDEIEQFKSMITIDYVFTRINRTNGSFEILGSMEDVIPSQISKVVEKMRKEPKLTDLVTLKNREKDKTYLQDFFNRNELYHIVNRSATNNGNSIIKERIYLAKLLLSDLKIDMYDLFYRFHVNRECGYDNNKRLTKEGVKHWIEYPGSFSVSENNVLNFLNELGKIKEN